MKPKTAAMQQTKRSICVLRQIDDFYILACKHHPLRHRKINNHHVGVVSAAQFLFKGHREWPEGAGRRSVAG